MIATDHREGITPLSSISEGILPQYRITMFFLIAPVSFSHYLPRAFLALLHNLIFLSLPLRNNSLMAFLTFWHFESVQKCKVCMGVISETC